MLQPGCSSFEGVIQENGPFQWQYGTYKPVPNPWAWNRLINTVWVEQPIGTGFSRGEVTATSEEDVAKQFLGFWKNFIETFSMQGEQFSEPFLVLTVFRARHFLFKTRMS